MDGSVSATEQQDYTQRLIAVEDRTRQASRTARAVVENDIVANVWLALPGRSVETYWNDAS